MSEKSSQIEKILNLLKDGNWHSTVELNKIAFRYGARLFDLRRMGYLFEKKRHSEHKSIELWRLIAEPYGA